MYKRKSRSLNPLAVHVVILLSQHAKPTLLKLNKMKCTNNGLMDFDRERNAILKDAQNLIALCQSDKGHLGDVIASLGITCSSLNLKKETLKAAFYSQKKTLGISQQSVIGELCGAYSLNAVLFNPSAVAGTFDRLNASQVVSICETAKRFGLQFSANVKEGTFLFAL